MIVNAQRPSHKPSESRTSQISSLCSHRSKVTTCACLAQLVNVDIMNSASQGVTIDWHFLIFTFTSYSSTIQLLEKKHLQYPMTFKRNCFSAKFKWKFAFYLVLTRNFLVLTRNYLNYLVQTRYFIVLTRNYFVLTRKLSRSNNKLSRSSKTLHGPYC